MVVAGIMTGTSLDAIDIAKCEISEKGNRQSISLLSFTSLPFSPDTYDSIRAALRNTASMEQLSDIPYLLARDYANAVESINNERDVQCVAVHGQTLWHHPPVSSWQAASGPALSALLSLPVVHDFRSADIALGGQGAPLVPAFDHATLASDESNVVALNIGGMANVTLLPSEVNREDVVAFDTGPGNVWIDTAVRVTFGKQYDTSGHIARAGRIIPPMFAECCSFPFYTQTPPKSTGRELFSEAEAARLITKYSHPSSPLEDVVTTMTEVTAWSIAEHIARHAPMSNQIIVSGGGSQNVFLLERIQHHLGERLISAKLLVHDDWKAKEAMAFAYLGWLTLNGLPGNIPRVTGASRGTVLGSIARC